MRHAKKKNTRPEKSFSAELKYRFDTWLLQHSQALVYSLGQYVKNPISTLLTTTVIGISLALPASFYLLLDNVRTVSSLQESPLQITLFLKPKIEEAHAAKLARQLTEHEMVDETRLINREEALAEYRRLSSFAEAIDALEENPLPNVIVIEPATKKMTEEATEVLITDLRTMPEVDTAQYDSQWMKRLLYILNIINRIIIILSILLATAVLLIIGNTIRLSIYNRRAEIETMKLFGGADSFIQRPFLYSGLWYGIFGSVLAWLLVTLSMQLLQTPVRELANLYGSDFQLIGLNLFNSLILFLIGVSLGLLGSFVSVKRHLASIEPV